MQTRFAVMTLHNAETATRAKVLVAYLDGKWAAMKLEARLVESLRLRDSAAHEPRISEIRFGLGTVNNRAKPFTEIAMLIKRHVQLAPRSYYYDDPMDWRLENTVETTLNEYYRVHGESRYAVDAMRHVVSRLWNQQGRAHVQGRIEAVLHNALAQQRHAQNPRHADYVGFLQAFSGAMIRSGGWATLPGEPLPGGLVFTSGFDNERYMETIQYFRDLGRLLAECIHMSHLGENFEQQYDRLLMMLSAPNSDGMLLPAQRDRLVSALAKIHNNTIELAECGHFEDACHRMPVGPSARRRLWCRHCWEHEAVEIANSHPRERWPREDAFWSENHQAYYSYDIDEEETPSSTDRRGNRAIIEYSTNVTRMLSADANIKSSHYGDFLMGIELEMTPGSADRYVAAKDVRRRLGPDYVVIKHDASVPDDGFEIVTAPRGLKEHIERFSQWDIDPRYRAWDTGQCGLHVHIHSRAFTEMTLGKFVMFFNRNDNAVFIRRIAGRHPLKDAWAARYCGQEGQASLHNPKLAIKGKSPERYRMINCTNMSSHEAVRLGLNHLVVSGKYDTVEVRVFKASLRKERLLAQIEFAHAAVMFCRVASYRELDGKNFVQWLMTNPTLYPNLADWLGTRRSKRLVEAKAKTLEEVCPDKVIGELVPPPVPRPVVRRLPSGINDRILPPVPKPRRRPGESELEFLLRTQPQRGTRSGVTAF